MRRNHSRRHAGRILVLMLAVACWLGWLVAQTEIFFADGLRYITQARQLERGDLRQGLRQAVDHPLYPLAIVGVHRGLSLPDSPASWQQAAQFAAATAGVLLVVPLYLVAAEIFGGSGAWLGVVLVFLVPVPGHVLADTLSESTFLLFWTWGVWATLRHLRQGSLRWLPVVLGFSGMAYLSRPEGLLLPAALLATLGLAPLWPAARLSARSWWSTIAVLGLGVVLAIGPYVALKGSVATKPAVARLLGLAPPSRADAVERERPLDPDQSATTTAMLAVRSTAAAVRDAVTWPLLPLAALGVGASLRREHHRRARLWLFLGVMSAGALLALLRLHATGGYCTPRHTLLLTLPLISASASGLRTILAWMPRALGRNPTWIRRAAPLGFCVAIAVVHARALTLPINDAFGGYRAAGAWIAQHAPRDETVVDVTGWSQYYADRPGYVFANLIAAPADPSARWVIARDAHLSGPWGYCTRLRELVADARLVARFPESRKPGRARVSVYERPRPPAALTQR